jgi:hypothetical protein
MRRPALAVAAVLLLITWLAAVALMGSASGACGPDASGLPGGVAGAQQSGGATALPPGPGKLTAATMYGGPGDPSSGATGASGKNLTATMSYAELGTSSFAPSFDGANNIGELFGLSKPLAYGTRLIATFPNGKSVVVEKLDIGQGSAPGGGYIGSTKKSIDFWYEVINKAYDRNTGNGGLWSGLVKLQPAGNTPLAGGSAGSATAQDCPAGQSGATASGVDGITNFDGSPCATWIANDLQQARQAGVQFQITPNNCYRSVADQARVCATGVKPCAAPGQSRHQGTKFPNGAVDVSTGVAPLEAYFRRNNIPLYNAGGKDPPHFSTGANAGLPGY